MSIPIDANPTTEFERQIEWCQKVSKLLGIEVVLVGVDTRIWKIRRIIISEHKPFERETGAAYQVLYLVKPLLKSLAG